MFALLALSTLLAIGPVMSVIIAVVVLGLIVWLIGMTPLPAPFQKAIWIIAIVVLIVVVGRFLIEYLGPYLNF